VDRPERRSLQQRIESSRGGRIVIGVLAAFTVAAMVITNAPQSELKSKLIGTTQPYLNFTGLDQNWGVFAPEPRKQGLELRASLRRANGTGGSWTPPSGGALIGAYWDYRWRKLLEFATDAGYSRTFWRPLAAYVARDATSRGGSPVVHVTLIKRTQAIRPPGQPGPRLSPWTDTQFFEYDVPGAQSL
jgi:hypothetical protein